MKIKVRLPFTDSYVTVKGCRPGDSKDTVLRRYYEGCMMAPDNFAYLRALADKVCEIDFAKNLQPEIVPAIIIMAGGIIEQMKSDLHDIGNLEQLIPPMASIWAHRREQLPVMISSAHSEIERLMGSMAGTAYSYE